MKFEWDPQKNNLNFIRHGIDFEEAKTVFEDENAITIYDDEHSENEDRFNIIGMSVKLRELIVCHCYRNGDEITRIISARRPTKTETKLYERRIGQ